MRKEEKMLRRKSGTRIEKGIFCLDFNESEVEKKEMLEEFLDQNLKQNEIEKIFLEESSNDDLNLEAKSWKILKKLNKLIKFKVQRNSHFRKESMDEILEKFIWERKLKKFDFGDFYSKEKLKIVKKKENLYLLVPSFVFNGKKNNCVSFQLKEKEVESILSEPYVFNSCRFFKKKDELKVELKKYVSVGKIKDPKKIETLKLINNVRMKGLRPEEVLEVLEWKEKARESLREG
jgi:hypothetical protein